MVSKKKENNNEKIAKLNSISDKYDIYFLYLI